MTKRWYVVQSKPKHELTAVQRLEDQSFTCYLPQLVITKKTRGRVVQLIEPLFPSYLFVNFNIDADRWRAISGTRGVVKLLGASEDNATPLPKGFVEEMLSKADERGYISVKTTEKVMRKFIPGDVLRVKDGPFEGFTGACQRTQKDCAVLLLSLLSGKIEINFPLNSVEFV